MMGLRQALLATTYVPFEADPQTPDHIVEPVTDSKLAPHDGSETLAINRVPSKRKLASSPRPPPLPLGESSKSGDRRSSLSDDAMLASAQTKAWCGGVSDMAIWRWLRDERVGFPQPIKINGRNYWRVGDLRDWQDRHANMKAN